MFRPTLERVARRGGGRRGSADAVAQQFRQRHGYRSRRRRRRRHGARRRSGKRARSSRSVCSRAGDRTPRRS